jgi:vacuolar protein sorting-associated protein VTA1
LTFVDFQLYDIITTFGDLSEEAAQCKKYAKWKAAYIHNCLKNGETPHPGPLPTEGEDELNAVGGADPPPPAAGGFSGGWQPQGPQAPYQPPQQPPSYQPQQPPVDPNMPFHLPDPPKEPEPKNPGGFVPYNPSTSDFPSDPSAGFASSGSTTRTPEQIAKAQKYCKFVVSALNYDDVPSAIDNLQKCLRLLQTGQDS